MALALMLLFVAGLWQHWWPIPNRHNPFGFIDWQEAPNWTTRFKLTRLSYQPEHCLATLRQSQLKFDSINETRHDNGCQQINPVRIRNGAIRYNAPFVLTCPAAVAWGLYERHGLQPAARELLGEDIIAIEHFGTYACRNQYHKPKARLSEHAHANAIDIAGFKTRNGKTISVLRDWPKQNRQAAFLREARDVACPIFNAVLSPDFNAAHHNHFHFDRGLYVSCR